MKARTKKSPDVSDSLFLCAFMARKLGLVSDEKAAPVVRKQMPGMDLSVPANTPARSARIMTYLLMC